MRLLLAALVVLFAVPTAYAFEPKVLESVVSLLPKWPGYERGGVGRVPPGTAPEGSAVAIRNQGYLVTARHVVANAVDIRARLPDGRIVPAQLIAGDPATDIAVLRIGQDLPVLPQFATAILGEQVCAVGNQFGLDLSVTCGVVSAVGRSNTGFNPVEDFIQTDAALNPGSSGGALVDNQGRLIGMLSAIFTKGSDANIGVNFAISATLINRVVEDLIAHGRVQEASIGLQAEVLTLDERLQHTGLRVIAATGPSEVAGVKAGDVLLAIDDRRLVHPKTLRAAVFLKRPGDTVSLSIVRAGEDKQVEVRLVGR